MAERGRTRAAKGLARKQMSKPGKREKSVVELSEQEKKKLKDKETAEIKQLEQKIEESTPARGEQPTASTTFADLPLSAYTQEEAGYVEPTQIQIASIPHALAGRDILGAAKTGSGKTLAFLIPLLERLYRKRWSSIDGVGAIVISPTRELAMQIFEVLRKVGKKHSFSAGLVVGGKDFKLEQTHVPRMSIIICTPGRLLQHLEQTPGMEVSNLEVLVLDEADRILDLGFSAQLNSIIKYLPGAGQRQTMLFSATQTKSVKDLARLSLDKPEYLGVHEKSEAATPATLIQSYVVCELGAKMDTLWSFLKSHVKSKIIAFFSTSRQVRFAHEAFCKLQPGLPVMCLHGKIKQERRTAIFYDFVNRPAAVLFATDIAARGLDFPAIDWVVQVDCPEDTATYIHRVGRTARYNKGGKSLLMLLPPEEGIVEHLKSAKIPISKIQANPNKLLSIQGKIAGLTAEFGELRVLAQKAFMSYVRSVHLMPDKEIFKVENLKLEEYAHSLGLVGAPRIKLFDETLSRESLRQQKNRSTKLQALKEKIKAEKERRRQAREQLKAEKLAKERSKQNAPSDSSSESSDEEDVMPKRAGGENIEKAKTASQGMRKADEGDDFLVVKRKIDWKEPDEDSGDRPETSAKKPKKLKIRPDRPISDGKKIIFDDEGDTVESSFERIVSKEGTKEEALHKDPKELALENEKYIAEVAARLKLREEEDKQRERERIQEKHRKRRLKEKAPKPSQEVGVTLGHMEEEYEDDGTDARESSAKDSSGESLSEGESESADNSDQEMEERDEQEEKRESTKLKSREDLVLKLLSSRRKDRS